MRSNATALFWPSACRAWRPTGLRARPASTYSGA